MGESVGENRHIEQGLSCEFQLHLEGMSGYGVVPMMVLVDCHTLHLFTVRHLKASLHLNAISPCSGCRSPTDTCTGPMVAVGIQT